MARGGFRGGGGFSGGGGGGQRRFNQTFDPFVDNKFLEYEAQRRVERDRVDALGRKIKPGSFLDLYEDENEEWERRQRDRQKFLAWMQQNAPHGSENYVTHDLGRYAIPREDSFDENLRVVTAEQMDLGFDPKDYPYFDNIVANAILDDRHNPVRYKMNERTGQEESYRDLSDPYYDSFKRNVAAVRNIVYIDILRRPGLTDAQRKEMLAEIATEIAVAYQRGTSHLSKPFAARMNIDRAIDPEKGAEYIYEFLRTEVQPTHDAWKHINLLNWRPRINLQESPWEIIQLDQQPWSLKPLTFKVREQDVPIPENASSSQPAPTVSPTSRQIKPASASPLQEKFGECGQMEDSLIDLYQHTPRREVVDLEQDTKARATQLGRDILDKLRFQMGAEDVEIAPLSEERPAVAACEVAQELTPALSILRDTTELLRLEDPAAMQDPLIRDGRVAAQKLTDYFLNQGKRVLEENGMQGQARGMAFLSGELPATWQGEDPKALLDTVERGLAQSLQRAQDQGLIDLTADAAQVMQPGETPVSALMAQTLKKRKLIDEYFVLTYDDALLAMQRAQETKAQKLAQTRTQDTQHSSAPGKFNFNAIIHPDEMELLRNLGVNLDSGEPPAPNRNAGQPGLRQSGRSTQ